MDDTLVVTDASQEEAVRALLASLPISDVETRVEIAIDYPGQQLAIDLWADSPVALARAVELIGTRLDRDLGLSAVLASELDRRTTVPKSA